MKTSEQQPGFRKRAFAATGAAVLAFSLGACSSANTAPVPSGYSSVVGIGGSYEAGFAAGPLVIGMPKRCLQTAAANPLQVARELGVPVHNFACSGAKTSDVLSKTGSKRQPAQLRLAERAMRDALVTVLVGGNDVGWMQYLEHCAQKGCASLPAAAIDSPRYQRLTHNIEAIVGTAYHDGARKVLVDGYVNPGKLDCLLTLGLTRHRMTHMDYQRIDQALWLLNGALESGAENAGAQYVPLDQAFFEHGVCVPKVAQGYVAVNESGPWLAGPHYLNGGGAWHPIQAGQNEIARLNLQAA
ncbi:MAG TPA: GDSL-type esterase/lipase family protein [Candidatus Saccharimonadales bacterium]|nr:GDSL-type esterase/lipase family protein [Candidatus Saccharimonadales bacterium]